MPSVSRKQQGFMGMVHAVQRGEIPLSKASPRVRHVATTMKPKDVTEFAATKHEGLPEVVDGDKKSASFVCSAIFGLCKQADISSIFNRLRGSVNRTAAVRRQHLEGEMKTLKKHNADLEKQLQKAQSDSMMANATLSAQPQVGPTPPPSQAPYGAMLMQQPGQTPGQPAQAGAGVPSPTGPAQLGQPPKPLKPAGR